MVEVESLYNMGYEQGLKDTLDKYDEIFRIASEIRIAVGCKTAKECWELARNGDIQVVKHAHWIHERLASTNGGSYAVIRCSNCLWQYPMEETKYCPNCGAKMDDTPTKKVDTPTENTNRPTDEVEE